ncbi:DUF4270 family protein [Aquimarina sp. TRL1]|uniref:DUF4270 family protein n=1 Tax=Aquimarina sp. (strain TRL1) TaxID=2736252 RepID=UPI0015897DDA|nr:DUF4270 family protein [Aquimarina sp. TRL1]QKX06605.1 DUF4270 family protein [Aquimarina sp. TRL1]
MKYICIITSLLLLFSCSKNEEDLSLEIGDDWIDGKTKVYYIDTISVATSTFKFDSLMMPNSKRILVGNYNDPVFGHTESQSYMELIGSSFSLDNEAIYDSIALILPYDNYYYNDTIPTQQIEVYEVLEEIKPEDDFFYNTSAFDYSGTPIATKRFSPTPRKEDSLHITVSNLFGIELFKKIVDDKINNNEEFTTDYRGITIKANEQNTAFLGFKKSGVLRVYYTLKEDTQVKELTMDFLINETKFFNQIKSDRSGTYFETLKEQKITIPSTDTDNNCFIQAGVGIATKIDIPFIERINDIPGTGTIIEASLNISLKHKSSTEYHTTRDSLQFYVINKNSEIVKELFTPTGVPVEGTITKDDSEFNVVNYVIPIKDFLDNKLHNSTYRELYLAMYSKEYNYAVDRYIFNGENAPNDKKVTLELTYAIYDEDDE